MTRVIGCATSSKPLLQLPFAIPCHARTQSCGCILTSETRRVLKMCGSTGAQCFDVIRFHYFTLVCFQLLVVPSSRSSMVFLEFF